MFDVQLLQQFYEPSFFGIDKERHVWVEKQQDPKALAKLEFIFSGGSISYVKSNMLKKMQDVFRTDASLTLNLRQISDGVLILDRNDEHYLVILEVKSGYSDVKRKAICQIPASYIKLKSILNDFDINIDQYKEFGLIVSYPFKAFPNTDAGNNPLVMENKQIMTGDVVAKYNKSLREHQSATFVGNDFGFDKLNHIKPNLLFNKLVVKHYPVTNNCVNAQVDLDSIISTL